MRLEADYERTNGKWSFTWRRTSTNISFWAEVGPLAFGLGLWRDNEH